MKIDTETLDDVIEVLEREISNYSEEFVPERITRIRAYIQKLKKQYSP